MEIMQERQAMVEHQIRPVEETRKRGSRRYQKGRQEQKY
jgi:hypothetical protein